MRTKHLFHLLCALLLTSNTLLPHAAGRADSSLEPFDGVWNVTIGPAGLGDKCQVDERSATRVWVPSRTSILWVYWTYRDVLSLDGRILTGTRPLDFGSFTAVGAPRGVVDEANKRGLHGELKIELAADGESFKGSETSYCIHWEGNDLIDVKSWAIPIAGRKVPVALQVLDQAGNEIGEVVQGKAFVVELTAEEEISAPSGSWLLWYHSEVDGGFDLPAAGAGQRFRSAELTVHPLPVDSTLDFFAEARAGRLYAAAGKPIRFEFRFVVAAAEALVRAGSAAPQ